MRPIKTNRHHRGALRRRRSNRYLCPHARQSTGQDLGPAGRGGQPGRRGAIIGTQSVACAQADGHTLLFTSYAFTSNPVLRSSLPYSAADLRPVALLGSSYSVLLLNNRLRGVSLNELVTLAKARPGDLKLASSGLASSTHIGAELFAKQPGIRFTHVP